MKGRIGGRKGRGERRGNRERLLSCEGRGEGKEREIKREKDDKKK